MWGKQADLGFGRSLERPARQKDATEEETALRLCFRQRIGLRPREATVHFRMRRLLVEDDGRPRSLAEAKAIRAAGSAMAFAQPKAGPIQY